MTDIVNFGLLGLGAGGAFAAVAIALLICYKGTGVVNFAAGAMAAWGAYVFDELRRTGTLVIATPVNFHSRLSADGYGGAPLVLLGLFAGGLAYLIARPIVRRVLRGHTAADAVALAISLAWGVTATVVLAATGSYFLPVPPHSYDVGTPSVALAAAIACAVVAAQGIAVHWLVFRPLRNSPPLARVVASAGLMATIQGLVVFRFGTAARVTPPILPSEQWHIGAFTVSSERAIVAGIVVVLGVALALFYRYTRLGIATTAGVESERSVALAGWAPDVLAATAWAMASAIACLVVILTLPFIPLSPGVHTLMVVPALACALVGRLKATGPIVAAGLLLGPLQSIVTNLSRESWWPTWAKTGIGDALPVVVLVGILFVTGSAIEGRGGVRAVRLPAVVVPRFRPFTFAAVTAGGLTLVLLTHGSYRFGVISSMIFAIAGLSLVLLTGLAGQTSLAHAAFAGAAGFMVARLERAGLGFPWSLAGGALAAALLGLMIGVPALRVRGPQLAIVTLAMALALERFVFSNEALGGGVQAVPDIHLFGVDFGIRNQTTIASWQFGVLVLVVLVLAVLLTGNLMRSASGRRLRAIRANERAASSLGVNVAANKLVTFAISAALAGVCGGLIGYSRGQLSPQSFTVFAGITFLTFAYLGGITSISGALIGGALAPLGISYVVIDRGIEVDRVYPIVAGLGLVVTAVLNPTGIAGSMSATFSGLVARMRRRRPAPVDADVRHHAATPTTVVGRAETASPAVPLLEVDDLRVRYGGVVAVRDVSLRARAGEIVGIIGPNGAGKTSMMDALTGFTACTGAVRVGGVDITELKPHQRARLGVVRTWQAGELFEDMTVRENLSVATASGSRTNTFAADILRPSRSASDEVVESTLDLIGLDAEIDRRCGDLSLGQQKLVSVARALASSPRVLLLDEPAAGLDSTESIEFGRRLRAIAADDRAVVLIDHDMGLVLDVCDYVYVLDFGELLDQGTPDHIRTSPEVIRAYLGSAANDMVGHMSMQPALP